MGALVLMILTFHVFWLLPGHSLLNSGVDASPSVVGDYPEDYDRNFNISAPETFEDFERLQMDDPGGGGGGGDPESQSLIDNFAALSLSSNVTFEDDFLRNESSSSAGNEEEEEGISGEDNGNNSSSPGGKRKRKKKIEFPTLRDPLVVAIPMTVIYALILLIGLVGNVSTCVVIAKNNYMHTATNYYLFSLAVSDLLLLISGLPSEMYLIWLKWPYIFGEAFCVIRGLAAETSANATVLTITAFTVERYVAICHPLRSHKLSQLSRVITIILLIWVFALVFALPQAAQFGVVDEERDGVVLIEGAWCSIIKNDLMHYAFQISIFVFFVIPMTMITGLYVLIGLKLRRSRGPNRANRELTVEPRNTNNRHSQSHVIRMLIAVVVAFFICWAPFHIQRLMAIYADYLGLAASPWLGIFYKIIYYVSGILYYVSTCINPILYHIMSNKFRQAFKDTMRQLLGRPPSRVQIRTYSSISHHRSGRMGLQHHLHHQYSTCGGSGRGEQQHYHQETCINCRHTPAMCSCRGNSHKYVRTYNLDQTGSDTTTVSLLSNSPPDKDPVNALASLDTRKGPTVSEALSQQPSNSEQSSGLKALISRKFRLLHHSSASAPPKDAAAAAAATPSETPTTPTNTPDESNLAATAPRQQQQQSLESTTKRSKNPSATQTPERPKNDPAVVTKISKGGKAKNILLSPRNRTNKLMRALRKTKEAPRLSSSSNKDIGVVVSDLILEDGSKQQDSCIIGGPGPIPITVSKEICCRAVSQTSVDSNNTISNSSLQDLDESEYTGEELAGVLAELKESLERPTIM